MDLDKNEKVFFYSKIDIYLPFPFHLENIFYIQKLQFRTILFPYKLCATGKSLSEALIFASTNPQYDDRLFIELQVQYMKIPSSNLWRTFFVQKLFLTFRTIFVHNMFSPCSPKRKASDKDLPVVASEIKNVEKF